MTTGALFLSIASLASGCGHDVPAPAPAGIPDPAGGVAGAVPPSGPPLAPLTRAGFVENSGQWDHRARFVVRTGGATAFLTGTGIRWVTSGESSAAVFLEFEGAAAPDIDASDPLPGRFSFFLGDDPGRWVTDVAHYRSLVYRSAYPGVDIRFHRTRRGIAYDLHLAGPAALEPFGLRVRGADDAEVDPRGALVVRAGSEALVQTAPRTYVTRPDGSRRGVPSRWTEVSEGLFRIEVPAAPPGSSLVVDPEILLSTYLGGSADEFVTGVAAGVDGSSYVVGYTISADFPTTPGAVSAASQPIDAFVARVDASGSGLVFGTYLGGSLSEWARGVAVHPSGDVFVSGDTDGGFPTTSGAFDTSYGGSTDVFVARLSSAGNQLVYSTYLGGSGIDWNEGVDVHPDGSAFVVGHTYSGNFPTTPNAFDSSNGGFSDACLTVIAPDGSSLRYSTFLGSPGTDRGTDVSVAPDGTAYVTGYTNDKGFPTSHAAFDGTHADQNGETDAFVARFDTTAAGNASLRFSTLLGAKGQDRGLSVAALESGGALVVGTTDTPSFPTTSGSFAEDYNGGGYLEGDVFVTRVHESGSSLVYSAFLGGSGNESAPRVEVDELGRGVVACATLSDDYPETADAAGSLPDGGPRVGLTILDPGGGHIVHSRILQVGYMESLGGLSVGGSVAHVAGTSLTHLPTTPSAYDATPNGAMDAYLQRVELSCRGDFVAYGSACPSSVGPSPKLVASGCLSPGDLVGLHVLHALPPTVGVMLIGTGAQAAGVVPGCSLQVAPLLPLAIPLTLAGPTTAIVAGVLPLPAAGDYYLQVFLADPPGPFGVTATQPLHLHVGP